MNLFRALFFLTLVGSVTAQVTTMGFDNAVRTEAPGTLLSHPVTNGSEPIGRTTSINYLNGWIIVGAEAPGSREGSDLSLRVYDISDPANPVRRLPSDFGLSYPNNLWIQDNYGWNAHGTAQYGNLLLPAPIRVNGFGGLVEWAARMAFRTSETCRCGIIARHRPGRGRRRCCGMARRTRTSKSRGSPW